MPGALRAGKSGAGENVSRVFEIHQFFCFFLFYQKKSLLAPPIIFRLSDQSSSFFCFYLFYQKMFSPLPLFSAVGL